MPPVAAVALHRLPLSPAPSSLLLARYEPSLRNAASGQRQAAPPLTDTSLFLTLPTHPVYAGAGGARDAFDALLFANEDLYPVESWTIELKCATSRRLLRRVRDTRPRQLTLSPLRHQCSCLVELAPPRSRPDSLQPDSHITPLTRPCSSRRYDAALLEFDGHAQARDSPSTHTAQSPPRPAGPTHHFRDQPPCAPRRVTTFRAPPSTRPPSGRTQSRPS